MDTAVSGQGSGREAEWAGVCRPGRGSRSCRPAATQMPVRWLPMSTLTKRRAWRAVRRTMRRRVAELSVQLRSGTASAAPSTPSCAGTAATDPAHRPPASHTALRDRRQRARGADCGSSPDRPEPAQPGTQADVPHHDALYRPGFRLAGGSPAPQPQRWHTRPEPPRPQARPGCRSGARQGSPEAARRFAAHPGNGTARSSPDPRVCTGCRCRDGKTTGSPHRAPDRPGVFCPATPAWHRTPGWSRVDGYRSCTSGLRYGRVVGPTDLFHPGREKQDDAGSRLACTAWRDPDCLRHTTAWKRRAAGTRQGRSLQLPPCSALYRRLNASPPEMSGTNQLLPYGTFRDSTTRGRATGTEAAPRSAKDLETPTCT